MPVRGAESRKVFYLLICRLVDQLYTPLTTHPSQFVVQSARLPDKTISTPFYTRSSLTTVNIC